MRPELKSSASCVQEATPKRRIVNANSIGKPETAYGKFARWYISNHVMTVCEKPLAIWKSALMHGDGWGVVAIWWNELPVSDAQGLTSLLPAPLCGLPEWRKDWLRSADVRRMEKLNRAVSAEVNREIHPSLRDCDHLAQVWHTVKLQDGSKVQVFATDPLDAIASYNKSLG